MRAIVMPIVPIGDWESVYRKFLLGVLKRVHLSRITFGSICSYPQAVRLMELKLGKANLISSHFDRRRGGVGDGRIRFPADLRERIFRHLIQTVQEAAPGLDIGLCLEEHSMFDRLGLRTSLGCCNCVL